MMVSVYESLTELGVADVKRLPKEQVISCWRGDPLPRNFSWCVALDPTNLWFYGSLPGGEVTLTGSSHGSVVEGLWEADVLELFIKDPSGEYFEFNVSPQGAWWATRLSSYRIRAKDFVLPRVLSVETTKGDGEWSSVVSIDRSSLPWDVGNEASMHVSGISHRGGARYLSSNRVIGVEPDFHHRDAFRPVELRPIPRAS